MTTKEIVSEHESRMEKAVEILRDQLKSIRTGKASTGLLENIKVDYYGAPTPLKQIATLAAPQPDTIIVKPFDPTCLRDIETAIKNSGLSIAPVVEGKMIRLNLPALSEERRRQFVQQTRQVGEQVKVSIRNIRRDANKHLEKEQKDKLITEDDFEKGKKQIDVVTKEHTDNVDLIIKTKSDEIMLD